MIPVRIELDAELMHMLGAANSLPGEVRGSATNNVVYILRLMEYGHSQQLPAGWLRRQQRPLEELLRGELQHALSVYPNDLHKAILAGVSTATLGITRELATNTPVDTGRAKGAWVARPPVGPPQQDGPVITASQQAAIRRRRAKEKR